MCCVLLELKHSQEEITFHCTQKHFFNLNNRIMSGKKSVVQKHNTKLHMRKSP